MKNYIIRPYISIGEIELNAKIVEINSFLNKEDSGIIASDTNYITINYNLGITVSYLKGFSSFIGVTINLLPIHEEFSFIDKNYNEVINYFKKFPGKIHYEEDVGIISEFLGISVYFEDGIKEVGIFVKEYIEEMIIGMQTINN